MIDTNRQSQSLTLSFADPTAAASTVLLEQKTSVIGASGSRDEGGNPVLIVWCYPPNVDQLLTSVGSISAREERVWPVWEAVSFSGSNQATLNYPLAQNVTVVSGSVLLRRIAVPGGGWTLTPSSASLHFDADQNALVASETVWGNAQVHYFAPFRVCYYTPAAFITDLADGSRSLSLQVGSVYAIKGETLASLALEVEYENDEESGTSEYARLYSKIVLDPNGPHECPYTGSGTNLKEFPHESVTTNNLDPAADLDPDNAFVDERVHLVVQLGLDGLFVYQRFNPPTYTGFGGAILHLRLGSAPTGRSPRWKDVFAQAELSVSTVLAMAGLTGHAVVQE